MNTEGLDYKGYQNKIWQLSEVAKTLNCHELGVVCNRTRTIISEVKFLSELIAHTLSNLHTDEIRQSETLRQEYHRVESTLEQFLHLTEQFALSRDRITSLDCNSTEFLNLFLPQSLTIQCEAKEEHHTM